MLIVIYSTLGLKELKKEFSLNDVKKSYHSDFYD